MFSVGGVAGGGVMIAIGGVKKCVCGVWVMGVVCGCVVQYTLSCVAVVHACVRVCMRDTMVCIMLGIIQVGQ